MANAIEVALKLQGGQIFIDEMGRARDATGRFVKMTADMAAAIEQGSVKVVSANERTARSNSDTEKSASGLSKAFHSFATDAAKYAAGLATFAVVQQTLGRAVTSVKDDFLSFNSEITESTAILDGVTPHIRQQLEEVATTVSTSLNYSAGEAAKGLYYLASAGKDTAQSMADLPIVARFARAGVLDLADATEYALDIQSAMGLRSQDAAQDMANLARVTDVVTKASLLSNATVEQLASSLERKAATSARTLGISLEEVTAVLSTFADQGLKGARAGSAFDIVLRELQKEALKHADAFKQYGVAVYDSTGNFRNVADIVRDLERALAGTTDQQKQLILTDLGFTAQSSPFIKALLGRSDSIRQYETDLKNAGGTTQEVSERQMQSIVNRIGQFRQEALAAARDEIPKLVGGIVQLAEIAEPAFRGIADAAQSSWEALSPFVTGLGALGAGSAVESLRGVSTAIGAATGFLSSHEEIIKLVALAYGTTLVRAVLQATNAMLVQKGTQIADWLSLLSVRIQVAALDFQEMAAAEGLAAAAGKGLFSILTSPTVLAAGVTLGIYELTTAISDAKSKADDLVESLTSGIDTNSMASLGAGIDQVTQKLQLQIAIAHQYGGFLGTLKGAAEIVTPFSDNTGLEAKANIDALVLSRQQLIDQNDDLQHGFVAVSRDLNFDLGPDADQFPARMQAIFEQMSKFAALKGIDLSGPWQEWVPVLEDAYTKTTALNAPMADLVGIAEDTASGFTDAADSVKNYKQALDAVIGVPIALRDAQADLYEALDKTTENIKKNGFSLDLTTEQGRAFQESASKNAKAIMSVAVAAYTQTGDVNAANFALLSGVAAYDQTLRAAGLTETQIAKVNEAMGLTPENLKIAIAVNDPDQAETFLTDTKAAADDLNGTDVVLTVHANGIKDLLNDFSNLKLFTDQFRPGGAGGIGDAIPGYTAPTMPSASNLAGQLASRIQGIFNHDTSTTLAPTDAGSFGTYTGGGGGGGGSAAAQEIVDVIRGLEGYIPKTGNGLLVNLFDPHGKFGTMVNTARQFSQYVQSGITAINTSATGTNLMFAAGVGAKDDQEQIKNYNQAVESMAQTYADLATATDQATADMLLSQGLTADEFTSTAHAIEEAAAAEKRTRGELQQVREQNLQTTRQVEDALFHVGDLSTTQYLQVLQRRLDGLHRYSTEWLATWDQIQQLTKQAQAIPAGNSLFPATVSLVDNQFNAGMIDRNQYLKELALRMAELEMSGQKYSDEWFAILAKSNGVLKDIADEAKSTADQMAQDQADALAKAAQAQQTAAQAIADAWNAVAAPIMKAGSLVDAFSGQLTVSGGTIQSFMGHQVEAAHRWADALKELQAEGLDPRILADLARQGPQSLGTATGLLSLGASGISGINSQYQDIAGVAGSLGSWASGSGGVGGIVLNGGINLQINSADGTVTMADVTTAIVQAFGTLQDMILIGASR